MAKRNFSDDTNEITITVMDQNENKTFYRLESDTKLSKVINSYNDKHGHKDGTLTFLFEGNRVYGKDTPARLGMVDGDEISVMEQRMGGSFIVFSPN